VIIDTVTSLYPVCVLSWLRYRRAQAQRGRITLSTQADRNGKVTTSLAKAFVDASDPGYSMQSIAVELASTNYKVG